MSLQTYTIEKVDSLINDLIEKPWGIFFPEKNNYHDSTFNLINFFINKYKVNNPSKTPIPLIPNDFDPEQTWEFLEMLFGQQLLEQLRQDLEQQQSQIHNNLQPQTEFDYDSLLQNGAANLQMIEEGKNLLGENSESEDLNINDSKSEEDIDEIGTEHFVDDDYYDQEEDDPEDSDNIEAENCTDQDSFIEQLEPQKNKKDSSIIKKKGSKSESTQSLNGNSEVENNDELDELSENELLAEDDDDFPKHALSTKKSQASSSTDDEDSDTGFPVAEDWDDDILDKMLDELEGTTKKSDKSSKTRKQKNQKLSSLNDEFFDLNEMEAFVKEAEEKAAEEDQDDSLNEKEDEDTSEEDENENLAIEAIQQDNTQAKWKYDEFFDDEEVPIKTLDETDKTPSVKKSKTSKNKKSVQDQPEDLVMKLNNERQKLNDMIDSLEEEAIQSKHWSLKGEVWSKQRPMNSLLELHLDIPRYYHNIPPETDTQLANENDTQKPDNNLDTIIKRRIMAQNFDDVEKIDTVLPHEELNKKEEHDESLDFKKSAFSLSDIFANMYMEQQSQSDPKPDNKFFISDKSKKEKENLTNTLTLFHKVMTKLDSLSHHHGAHLPPSIKHPDAINQSSDVPILQIEEAVPIVMASNNIQQKLVHNQSSLKKKLQNKEELQRSEKRTLRNRNKEKQRKKLINNVETKKLTIASFKDKKNGVKQKKDFNSKQLENRRKKGLAIGIL